jgi:hypothetical protein
MFTMVRSNLNKNSGVLPWYQCMCWFTLRCEDKVHSIYTRKILPVVYGLEQQQQKSNMGWLFFTWHVTFYENVNV